MTIAARSEYGAVIIWREKGTRFEVLKIRHRTRKGRWQEKFPGGGKEACDIDILDCAVRECEEETGLRFPRDAAIKIYTKDRPDDDGGIHRQSFFLVHSMHCKGEMRTDGHWENDSFHEAPEWVDAFDFLGRVFYSHLMPLRVFLHKVRMIPRLG